jgi:DNA-3-methyladenine glycosylase II
VPQVNTIAPRGPFSWSASLDMLRTWQPVKHFAGPEGTALIAFGLDRSFEPIGAMVREEGAGLAVELSGAHASEAAVAQVSRMFSLDVDASDYPLVGRRDPAIGRVMRAFPGLRPVLFPSPYEAAVWAVLSQRIAQTQAARVKAALTAAQGEAVRIGTQEVRVLPAPERLLKIQAFAGVPAEKIARLHGVARAALEGLLDATQLRSLGHEEALRSLQKIRGIGPFWSGGIYLRAAGVTEPFPIDEPRTLRALADAHGLTDVPTGDELRRIVERFTPFGMWVSVLLRVAANRGSMGEPRG